MTGANSTHSNKSLAQRITGLQSDDVAPTSADISKDGLNVNFAQRITGLKTEDVAPSSADITVDGLKVNLAEEEAKDQQELRDAEEKAKKEAEVKKVSLVESTAGNWVDHNDSGDTNPEMRVLRKKMKEGILTYDSYMREKGMLVQLQ